MPNCLIGIKFLAILSPAILSLSFLSPPFLCLAFLSLAVLFPLGDASFETSRASHSSTAPLAPRAFPESASAILAPASYANKIFPTLLRPAARTVLSNANIAPSFRAHQITLAFPSLLTPLILRLLCLCVMSRYSMPNEFLLVILSLATLSSLGDASFETTRAFHSSTARLAR